MMQEDRCMSGRSMRRSMQSRGGCYETPPNKSLQTDAVLLDQYLFPMRWARVGEVNTLESELEQIRGISKGDARHLVSWIFGGDTEALDFHPTISCFVSEDEPLREALLQFQPRATNRALREANILSVAEFVALIRAQLG
ncbi:hypothetical protein [Sorangium sp. So ce1182]|uniref:hypothetical protein n=1 Tax=Sorangium sp. So ce1182 TaxID=3133334 RepID=UPI003F639596